MTHKLNIYKCYHIIKKGNKTINYWEKYLEYKLRWYLFFDWIKKVKILDFFFWPKRNMLISTNIIKVNLLLTSSQFSYISWYNKYVIFNWIENSNI